MKPHIYLDYAATTPSDERVLSNLGDSSELAMGSLRISLGKDTTHTEMDRFLRILPDCVERVREAAA